MCEQQNLTPEEIVEKIDDLSDGDYLKLAQMRRVWCNNIRGWSADDLFHETLTRLLEGKRHVPTDVNFTYALANIMRSIASDMREQQTKFTMDVSDEELEIEDTRSTLDSLINEETLIDLQKRVGNDNTAAKVLRLRAQEFSPDEICSKLSIRRTTYDSALKRIRRAVLKESEDQ
jgi:DNA-directed RNA polymerase specialized sigma24 family protein